MKDYQTPIFERDGYICQNCYGSIHQYGTPQVAHLIPQRMKKKYGVHIIHHPRNLASVCCLKCNDAVSISNHPREIASVVATIQEEISGGH